MSEKVVVEFCNEMVSTRSIKQKKEILSKYSDQVIVVSMLKFLLDKTPSGMTLKRLSKSVEEVTDCTGISSLEDAIQYLNTNNSGEDCDIRLIQEYLESIPESYKETVTSILTKDLRLGVDIKTVAQFMPVTQDSVTPPELCVVTSVDTSSKRHLYVIEKPPGVYGICDGKVFVDDQGHKVSISDDTLKDVIKLFSNFNQDMLIIGVLSTDSVLSIIDIVQKDSYQNNLYVSVLKERSGRLAGLSSIVSPLNKVRFSTMLYDGYDVEDVYTSFSQVKETDADGIFIYMDTESIAEALMFMPCNSVDQFTIKSVEETYDGVLLLTLQKEDREYITSCSDVNSLPSQLLDVEDPSGLSVSVSHRGSYRTNLSSKRRLIRPKIISVN